MAAKVLCIAFIAFCITGLEAWPNRGWGNPGGSSSSSERFTPPRTPALGITNECDDILTNTTATLHTLVDRLFAYYVNVYPEILNLYVTYDLQFDFKAEGAFLSAWQAINSHVASYRAITPFIFDCKGRLLSFINSLSTALSNLDAALSNMNVFADPSVVSPDVQEDYENWVGLLTQIATEKNAILGCFVVVEIPTSGGGGISPGEGEQQPIHP